MRIFLTKKFNQYARKEGIADKSLKELETDMRQGLGVVSLGADVYKMRLAKPGGGKSGGHRIILCTKRQNTLFFIHGYSKSVQENLNKEEDQQLKCFAADLFLFNDSQLDQAVAMEELRELQDEEEI